MPDPLDLVAVIKGVLMEHHADYIGFGCQCGFQHDGTYAARDLHRAQKIAEVLIAAVD